MAASGRTPYTLVCPQSSDTVAGAHCVCLLGYDDNKMTADGSGAFYARNSWGTSWGSSGDFYISYTYMVAYAYDVYALA